jgi:hypothetical protein
VAHPRSPHLDALLHLLYEFAPANKALQRTRNTSAQLTHRAVWRHTVSAGSGPVSAVAGR